MYDSEKDPRYVYRVVDDESSCKYDEVQGFVASRPNAIYDPDHWNATDELEWHMDWSNRKPTPFVSTTSSREKALEDALRRVGSKHGNVLIAKIDLSLLPPRDVYYMMDLVEYTGAAIKPEARNNYEYLIVRQIPRSAIIEHLTFDDED